MTRYRITVRGERIELRGYLDGDDAMRALGQGLQDNMPDAMVIASYAADDYDPFTDDDGPLPTAAKIRELADEAERGYDVESITPAPPRPGSPPIPNTKEQNIAFRKAWDARVDEGRAREQEGR